MINRSGSYDDAVLSLRGRAAWAHDDWSGLTYTPSFLSLPGTLWSETGAPPPRDLLLASAVAEVSFRNGISLAAKFDAELSQRSPNLHRFRTPCAITGDCGRHRCMVTPLENGKTQNAKNSVIDILPIKTRRVIQILFRAGAALSIRPPLARRCSRRSPASRGAEARWRPFRLAHPAASVIPRVIAMRSKARTGRLRCDAIRARRSTETTAGCTISASRFSCFGFGKRASSTSSSRASPGQ